MTMLTTTPTTTLRRHAQKRLSKHAFPLESALVASLCENSGQLASSGGGTHLRREWALGHRIADVAIYSLEPLPASHALLHQLTKLGTPELLVLSHFLNKPKSLVELRQEVFMREGELDKVVSRLASAGLIRLENTGRLAPSEWVQWIPKDLHFIEAKIEDWREAIEQARYYQSYGDSASVALPASFSDRADVIEACKRAGVGLILVGAQNTTQTVLSPKAGPPLPSPRKIACHLQILRRHMLDFLHGRSIQSAAVCG